MTTYTHTYILMTISQIDETTLGAGWPSGRAWESRPQGYKTFFKLSSAETKICPAHKYQNSPNKLNFLAKIIKACNLS